VFSLEPFSQYLFDNLLMRSMRNVFSAVFAVQRIVLAVLVGVVVLCIPHSAFAALPAGFEIETITAGLDLPTAMTFAPDGRIFVAEKLGKVRVVKNGALLPTPLITLSDVNTYGDRGLIGIAVDPNFATNGYMYLSYTYENSPGSGFSERKTGRIVRVTVAGDIALESSKVVLVGTVGGNVVTPSCDNYAVTVDCIPSDSSSHSVGALHFGPDGKLYASLGDGAAFDIVDPRSERAQNLNSLAGKLLRINSDGTAPADNPFYDGNPNSNRSKVYAYGFRNMFRFNFNAQTGALYGGDVGWDTWEEVNRIVSGGNYGWPCREGDYQALGQTCVAPSPVNPQYVYIHDPFIGGSVTGGVFPAPSAYPPAYANTMFFGDFALNFIKMMNVGTSGTQAIVTDFMNGADGADGPVDFEVGPEGYVYYISIYTGEVRRINYTLGNRQPILQISATPVSGLSPLSVTFSSVGSSDPDGDALSYLWKFGDGTTSTQASPLHTYTANGTYTVVAQVFDGNGGTQIRNLTIAVGNRAPVPTIITPLSGDLYSPGQSLTVTGSATDPEQGTLSGSALSWRVILHHNEHIHILETHVGATFQMAPPDHGDPDVYTEIELTATDAGGVTTKTSVNIYLNNSISPDGNMVQNASLETIDPLDGTKPQLWNKSRWGGNTAVFTYPVAGFAGTNLRAGRIQMSAYVDGDAKWSFDPTYILPNTSYRFTNRYIATVPTRLVAAVVLQDGTNVYEELAVVPASGAWALNQVTYITPPNARSIVVYHIIEANGTLTVDDYTFMLTSAIPPPPPTTNLIVNHSFEVAVGALPQAWASSKWGTNTAVFTYPVPGQDGVSAARVTVSGYTSGDAKWYFQDVPVVSGNTYTFSDYYQGSVPSAIVARFTSPTGVNSYLDLGVVPASAGWATAVRTITIPANTVGLSVFHLLSSNGTLTVDNFSLTSGTTTPPSETNLILNGFMETASTTVPTVPLGWTPVSNGGITTAFTYPTIGVDGGKAAQLQVTAYPSGADGDARWQFVDVPITTGTEYTYEGFYKGSTISDIIGRYTFNDGSIHYFGLKKEIPAATDWTPVTGKFVGPVNVRSITLMHQVSTIATLSIDNMSLKATGTGVPNEIIPPTQAFTNPLQGATVSGIVTLTATATDNVGIAGLFFAVDGTPLGPEMLAPYTIQWDSRTVPDGLHSLKVTSRDAVGNNNRQIITVTVNNTTPPPTGTSTNLILNPSMETAGAGGNPLNWSSNKWGTNTAVFTYPVAGQDGASGARVTVSGYTSGDAKWYFQDVPVTSTKTYQYSNYYLSTASTRQVARFTSTTGAVSYVELGTLPAAASWTKTTRSIVPPLGTASMTVFHVLAGNGQLSVDTFSLTDGTSTSTPDTTAPTVSVTAPLSGATVSGASVTITANASDAGGVAGVRFTLDGVTIGVEDTTSPYSVSWNSTATTNGSHTLRAIARDVAGNVATSTVVTVTVNNVATSTNLILNPSMETAGAGGKPLNWNSNKWGTNTAVFTYPVAGQDGASGAQIAMSAYASGDAKWFFDDVNVTVGRTYTFSEYSRATVPTAYVIRYTRTDGTVSYVDLGSVPASPSAWQRFTATFVPPANTRSVTIFHIITAVGTLTTDNAVLN